MLAAGGAEPTDVAIESTIVSGATANTVSIRFDVADAGFAQGWFDWNNDGTYASNESIFDPAADEVTSGTNRLAFDVPAGLATGTYRYRITCGTGSGPPFSVSGGMVGVDDPSADVASAADAVTAEVGVPGNRLSLAFDGDDAVVRRRDRIVYRVGVEDVAGLNIQGDEFSGVFTYVTDDGSDPPLPVRFDGGGLIDTVAIDGPLTRLDLGDTPAIELRNVEVVSLDGGVGTRLVVSSTGLAAVAGGGELIVSGDTEDTIDLSDPDAFRLGDRNNVGGEIFRSVRGGGTTLQFNVGDFSADNGWHNFLRPADIDNDGTVEPIDALIILNTLRRDAFHNPATGELFDVDTVDPFPGEYYDHNLDGRITPLDALGVLNELRRRSAAGEPIMRSIAMLEPLPSETGIASDEDRDTNRLF